MQTAKQYATASVISDLKEVCGDRFQHIPPRLKFTLLATLTQYQLLRQTHATTSLHHFLMEEACNSVPVVCWLGYKEIQERVMRCCRLDAAAIASLIKELAVAL